MKYKTTKHIVLSTSLILILNACGGGAGNVNSQNETSSAKVEQNTNGAPYINEVLTPKDMPKFSRDYDKSKKTTISLNGQYSENQEIIVTLSNMLGQSDWVGIYPSGSSNDWDNVVSWTWTGDIEKGDVKLSGVPAGEYDIRAFFQNSFDTVAQTTITVSSANGGAVKPTLSANSVNANDPIVVNVKNLKGDDKNWIGIYPSGSSNAWENVIAWTWTNGVKNGDVTLDGVPAGDYDVRVFYNNSFDVEASSTLEVKQIVNNKPIKISLNQDTYNENESITVNLNNMNGNEDDWVGIYPSGSSNDWENVVSWSFTNGIKNGTVTLDGVSAGDYDVRVFQNNSFDLEASASITVKEADNQNDGINKLALFADEHDPHDRLLAFDYGNMKLVDQVHVTGSHNHHADVVGTLESAKYVMMVPKSSKFVTFRDIKTREFVKKLNLPMRPRSADAYNKSKNLILLTAADRPAAVLIDADNLNIVGRAGFNISCDLKFNYESYHPWYYKRLVYKWNDIPENKINCVAPDFGGQNISGHPRWLSSDAFVILDRANRLLHVYRISKKSNGQWRTTLTDTVRTSTSLHQMIPENENDPNNTIFYGMTEGNGGAKGAEGIAPVMYKWKYRNGKLIELGKTSLITTKSIQLMKQVNTYDRYVSYQNHIKNLYKQYYRYYYPTRYSNSYRRYYPGSYSSYYSSYYNNYNNYYRNNIVNYQQYYKRYVPVTVQKQIKSLGGHNLYITPNLNYLYGAVASGQTFVVDKNSMSIVSVIPSGTGAGHVNFMNDRPLGVITNHKDTFVTIFNYKTHKFVKNVNLNFEKENISTLLQSHSPYCDEDGKYFYNTWTDGGIFFRVNMDTLDVDASEYVGGIPIQGNYFPHINE